MRPCGTFDVKYNQDMSVVRTRFQWVMLVVFLLALFILLPLFASGHWLAVTNLIAIDIIVILGLNLLTGYCGQISLGQAAFMMVGAYTGAIAASKAGLDFWVCLPLVIVVSILVGLIFGAPSLRLKGFYIAMSTLAAQYIIPWAIIHIPNLSGGVFGCHTPPVKLGSMTFDTEREWFYLIMTFAVILTVIAKNIARSKLGKAFIAVRDSDLAASILGINVFRTKIIAFSICSVYAGLGGCLFAYYIGIAHLEHFSLLNSIWYLGMIIVGGMGSIAGSIFGAAFLRLLIEFTAKITPWLMQAAPGVSEGLASGIAPFTLGLVILLFLIFEPRGLYHRWEIAKSTMRLWPFPY